MSALLFLTYSTLGGLIALTIANIGVGNKLLGFDQVTWTMFIIQGVILHAGGWGILNYVQGFVPAVVLSIVLLGQPVVTAITSYFIFGESFTTWHLLGGLSLLIGLIFVLLSRRKA
jgi:drug/metabolite transporter (DMT)-like permease